MTTGLSDVAQVTAIQGVMLMPLRQIVDDRGAVLHMLRSDAPYFGSFGECYFSEVNPGVVKAWKLHQQQTQNITVPIGKIRIVLFDNRQHSKSYAEQLIIELGRPEAYQLLQIPPGVMYGFQCITDYPSLLANCADIPHDPSEAQHIPLENSLCSYSWL